MTSALTMTSGRSNSQKRLLSLTACSKDNASLGYSGSPLINSSDMDLDTMTKQDGKKNDVDDTSRSASDYLSKLLNSRDLSNDLEGSPSTLSNSEANGFAYVPMKSTSHSAPSTRNLSSQRSSYSNHRRSNRSSHSHKHKPAEVFRKDLISAMKLPDNSQLLQEEYWVMQDPWRIEWEKGVQVPVSQKTIPSRCVRDVSKETYGRFQMPRKMFKSSPDPGDKEMVDYNILADSTCRYDLDELDVQWLKEVNLERKRMNLKVLDEYSMEKIMEELEIKCHENLQLAIQTKEGLGIEYDENVVCDVCRSLDCEDGNEMVFCDGCNLCVHQACYGIVKVPEGSWLCKLCALGIRGSTTCILCDRKGGAMKSTRSGNKWAHVSCALWIPEITISDPERMEPISKVSHVPASRWALLCSICKERVGACIQCSVKQCVTAYHVTCAIEAKLDMDTDCFSNDSDDEPVIFKSFCKKHSTKRKASDAEEDEQSEEEKRSQRQHRIMEMEEEFYTQVKPSAVATFLSIPFETAEQVMVYWKLKRKANFNKPLITPKNEEDTALAEAAETNLQRRLRMFTHLRQDLERVRNLCYMIGRREKTKRASVKNMESVFLTQMKVLERRMCEETTYDSKRMIPFLRKNGMPEVCELARKEFVILTKSKEWSLNADDSDATKTDSSVSALKKEIETERALPTTSLNEANKSASADKSDAQKAAESLKNGLHRKAFESACQKREVLLRRGRRKISHNSTSKEHHGTSSQRKRSHRSNSDSDFENIAVTAVDKTSTKKKSRLDKSQSWTRWQATKKDPPSRNEPAEVDGAALSSKTNRVGIRRSRTASIVSDTSVLNSDTSDRLTVDTKTMHHGLLEPQMTRNEDHLVVKWDSEKNDDSPDITKKTTVGKDRKLSLTEDKVRTKSKSETVESSDSEHLTPRTQRSLRSSIPEEKLVKKEEKVKKPGSSRTPHRRSAKKAKNEPGALALSCDLKDEDASSEQGLQQQHHPQSPSPAKLDNHRRSSSRADTDWNLSSMLENMPREEEDRGYRGDMDESDSDAPGTSRHKTTLTRHRSLHKEAPPLKFTDTSESCFEEAKKLLSPRKRRLKSHSRTLLERKESLVAFQGFQDFEDGSSEPKEKSLKTSPKPDDSAALKSSEKIIEAVVATKILDPKSPKLEVVLDKIPEEVVKEKSSDILKYQSPTSPITQSDLFPNTTADSEVKSLKPDAAIQTDRPDITNDLKVKSPEPGVVTQPDLPNTTADSTLQSPEPATEAQTDPPNITAHSLVETLEPVVDGDTAPLTVENEDNELSVALTDNASSEVMPGMYDAMQNYQAAYYNPHMYSQGSMVNMAIQQTFYYQQYYQYWQAPPPPPPPPPPPEEEPPEKNEEVSEQLLSQESNTIPDSQLEFSNFAPCNQHFDNSLQQVQYIPTFSDPFPNASEVQTHPRTSSLGDEIEGHAKKKKKKSKKKKKKKKKRKHSKMEHNSSKEGFSSANSESDEWGVEYCSVLVDEQPIEDQNSISKPASPKDTQPNSSILPSLDLPLEDSSIKTETEPQTESKKESKLLLKLDKSKFTSPPSVKDSSDSESSSENAPFEEEEEAKLNKKPFIMPLKLKLCGQKSDRTLRGGLVAREYQILESGIPENSSEPISQDYGQAKSPVISSVPEIKPIHAATSSNKSKSTKSSPKDAKSVKQKKNTSKKHAVSKSPAQSASTSGLVTSLLPSKSSDKGPGPPSNVQPKPKEPTAIPERHWKKRKLHVHEASVTTNASSGGKSPLKKTNALSSQTSTSATIPSITNYLIKPTESDKKSIGINHLSLSSQNDIVKSPSRSTIKPPPPRRKKTAESNKTASEKNTTKLLPHVSPYKFTVSKTHQKKVASAGGSETPENTKDLNLQSAAVPTENDPYAFAEFGEM